MRSHLGCAGLFGMLGPIFGLLGVMVIAIPLMPSGLEEEPAVLRSMAGGLFFTVVFGFIAVPFAWLIGGIPAAITGLCYSVLARRVKIRNPWVLSLLGMLVGGAVCALLFALMNDMGELALLASWGYFILPGAFAAFLCAFVWEKGWGRSKQNSAISARPPDQRQ